MRTIACVNQKGGVGKTTICANLAYALAEQGHRVLIIDMDPQGHLAQSYGIYDFKGEGIERVLADNWPLQDIRQTLTDKLHLLPAGPRLIRLESAQMAKGRGLLLKKRLATQVNSDYDFCLLDCPPSSGFLVVNAIAAARELIVPVTPDFFGLSGLSSMLRSIEKYEQVLGDYDKVWVVVSRMHKRKLTDDVMTKLKHYLGEELVPFPIAERAVLAECPSYGESVLQYAPQSDTSKTFRQIAQWIQDPQEVTNG